VSGTQCQGHAVLRRGRRHLSLFLLAVFLPLLVPPDAWASLTRPPLPEPGPFVRTAHAASTCDPQDSATAAVTLYRVRLAWLWPGVIRATVAPEPLCTRAASSALDLIRAAERDPKTPYPGVFRKANVGYDELGRLATVSVHKQQGVVLTQPEVTTYAYTEVGSRESMVLPNGVTTLYSYDNLNRLTNLSHFSSTNQLLAGYAYTLAPTGRRTGVYERIRQGDAALAERNIAYSYDALNRLTQEDARFVVPPSGGPDSPQTFTTDYSYDLVGNRLVKATTRNQDGVAESISYVQNANDQIVTETSSIKGVTTYGYNENGSLISKTNGTTGESVSYSYNLENRLIAADIARVEKDSQGASHNVAISSTYAYNQSGIRTRADSTTTIAGQAPYDTARIFLNDAMNLTGYSQVMEEFNGTGLARSYVIGDDHISQTVGGTTSFLAMDGHGSTRLLTDSNGGITDGFSFDAYGCQLGPKSNVVNPAATSLLYSGETQDFDLDMQYLRARYYDQNTGAFASLDPFGGNNGDPQSLHKYLYCHGDPVNGLDPSGEFTLIELVVVAAVMILAVPGCAPVRRPGRINVVHSQRNTIENTLSRFRNMPPESLLRQAVDHADQVQHRIRPLADRRDTHGNPFSYPFTDGSVTYYDPRSYTLPTPTGPRTWTPAQALAHELLHRFWRDQGMNDLGHTDPTWNEEEIRICREAAQAEQQPQP